MSDRLAALLVGGALAVAAPVVAQPPPAAPLPSPVSSRPRPVQVMSLESPAWADGGLIPAAHTQVGRDVSPPLDVERRARGHRDVRARRPRSRCGGAGRRRRPAALARVEHLRHRHGACRPACPPATRPSRRAAPGPAPRPPDRRPAADRAPPAPATAGRRRRRPARCTTTSSSCTRSTSGSTCRRWGSRPRSTRAAVMAAMAGHVRGKGVLTGRYRRPTP